jgi:hypothetical protein
MNILSPRAHGYIDYLVVIGFFSGPRVFEFDGVAATIAYTLAAVHLVLTLATDFPLGLARIIPFPLHGIIEFFVGVVLLGLPWVASFSGDETAKLFFLCAGASVILVFLLTNYRATPRT